MEKPVDFLELSKNALRADATIEDKNKLFKLFFELNEWIFILSNDQHYMDARLFISEVDSKQWIYVFTDRNNAMEFGKKNAERFINKDGGVNYMAIKTKDALKMINDLSKSNVFGVQINYGLPGWFVPIASLDGIIKQLKIELI